uniref:Serine hydrolase like n=1 Tax=Neogobius melanostomus TaxID=47308 RepID=A0A8C6S889_9GOBI
MATPVSELVVPVPWGELRGRVWGPTHGYPVLCLHGWADNCGSFNPLVSLLPKECRYVAIDLAGHGLSSHHPPGVFYTLPSYVADVRRVVDCEFVYSSLLFSALYPEMVDALVLLDAKQFVVTDSKTASKMRQGMDEMIQFEKLSRKKKVYTYEKALERLLAASPLTKQSAQILLERGLVPVQGGMSLNYLIYLCLTVPGDHHVHLNNPQHVAPFISNFMKTKLTSCTAKL